MKINPTNDLIFKKVFTDKANQSVLLGFINDFTGEKFESVEYVSPYNLYIQHMKQKIQEDRNNNQRSVSFTEVDVRVSDQKGKQATIEMQVLPQTLFVNRSLYYLSDTYRKAYNDPNYMKNNDKYSSLKDTYGINVTNFDPIGNGRAFNYFELVERFTHTKLSDFRNTETLQVCYLNLKSSDFSEIDTKTSDNLKYWQKFFNSEELGINAPSYIKQAEQTVNNLSLNREEQELMETMQFHTVTMEEYAEDYARMREEEVREEMQAKTDAANEKADLARQEADQVRNAVFDFYYQGIIDYNQLIESSGLKEDEVNKKIQDHLNEKQYSLDGEIEI
ncbi:MULTISPECIES: PD-(D/E)XK nuclease family transposase [Aerococcus]|uniref:PD-(D/E)XK nuclease family transposase n=1 Tax=Aerococcus TaxID=1375 RepID=UPI0018A6DE47|nr:MULTISPECIES: PD-(D/E)XK nuclease family transposase [Aerococcus]MCY3067584.1 PD-(D/E)XK nuclease family transposase [Aerococcus mictus]MCY3080881.1 PD-(D/E)XK nuclease family transposase [Aerococcus mictus]MDK8485486.1 PD-(D/E)XK nuclease family transposase [Aerococcus urinae]